MYLFEVSDLFENTGYHLELFFKNYKMICLRNNCRQISTVHGIKIEKQAAKIFDVLVSHNILLHFDNFFRKFGGTLL